MDENQVDAVIDNAAPAIEQEKMIPQSQVNAIVQHTKAKAAEKAKQEAHEQYQREIANLQASRSDNTSSSHVDEDAMYQKFREKLNDELKQNQLQEHVKNVANAYTSKMQAGSQTYDDFDQVMKDFDPAAFPQLVFLVSGMDNAADIMYELRNNPSKLVTIDALSRTSPQLAQSELTKISSSIAQNKQAMADAQGNRVQPPLDQLQPSRVSGSNSNMSIQDLRNMPYLRG